MSAEIEPLHQTGKNSWGAKAAAADAVNRVANDAPFLAVWIEKAENGEEIVKWSKANCTFGIYSIMGVAIMEFAQSMVREAMEKNK